MLVAAMVLIGLGTGVHKTVSISLLSAVYPERTGRTLGIMDTAGSFGGVVAPAVVVVFLGGFGWHALFLVAGLVGLGLAALFVIRNPSQQAERAGKRTKEETEDQPTMAAYVQCFTEPRFAAFILVTVGFSFTYNGAVAFLPLYLVDAGIGAGVASGLYSVFFLVSVVQLVTGDMSDRFGQLSVIAISLLSATVGLGLLLVPLGRLGTVGFAAGAVIYGLGSHGFRPVRGAYLVSVIPESISSGTLGVVRTLLMGAGAVAPAIVGFVSEYAGFRAAFGLLLGALVLATGIVGVLLVAERVRE